jgi:hypothetical protein
MKTLDIHTVLQEKTHQVHIFITDGVEKKVNTDEVVGSFVGTKDYYSSLNQSMNLVTHFFLLFRRYWFARQCFPRNKSRITVKLLRILVNYYNKTGRMWPTNRQKITCVEALRCS